MDFYICTISSSSRLYQCLALHDSLDQFLENMKFFVLCMDEETYSILDALKSSHLLPIKLKELESEDLLKLKQERNISEYCWTMKPILIEYIMENYEEAHRVTYLDADLYFFNNPKPIYTSGFGKSVWMTRHNYNDCIKDLAKEVGKYNSGFISFKRNKYGMDCLKWWKKRCMEWCYNTTVGGKFGDQKYLDDFQGLFEGVTDISIPGVNVAPWNDMDMVYETSNGRILCSGNKLIFYHFCGFRLLGKNEFIVQFGNTCKEIIHIPYMEALKKVILKVDNIDPRFNGYYPIDSEKEKYKVFKV